jgi:hypothetical protein
MVGCVARSAQSQKHAPLHDCLRALAPIRSRRHRVSHARWCWRAQRRIAACRLRTAFAVCSPCQPPPPNRRAGASPVSQQMQLRPGLRWPICPSSAARTASTRPSRPDGRAPPVSRLCSNARNPWLPLGRLAPSRPTCSISSWVAHRHN